MAPLQYCAPTFLKQYPLGVTHNHRFAGREADDELRIAGAFRLSLMQSHDSAGYKFRIPKGVADENGEPNQDRNYDQTNPSRDPNPLLPNQAGYLSVAIQSTM